MFFFQNHFLRRSFFVAYHIVGYGRLKWLLLLVAQRDFRHTERTDLL